MFTDLVGYTALTQENESAALSLLRKHAELLRPLFSKHGGHEVKMIGDSFLVEFSSALSASLCAVEIQRTLYEYNTANPSSKIGLRIGIHVGDVVYQGADVFGDAVNIASRIEPLASPGSICISQQVYDQVWNKIDHPLAGLGKRELKNVQIPMEVYRIVLPWEKEAIGGEARKVLPLVDRIDELEALKVMLEKTARGEGNLVFVAGEAGVGKTRVADELVALAKSKHITTLSGRCSRREGKIPYAPWIEMVREFVRGNPTQLLFKVVGNYGGEVAKIVPEIAASLGPVSGISSGSVDQDRVRFIDAISQVIINVSKEGPILLVIDDMNWADAGSLDLLLSTARQTSNNRMLILAIYRDVEVEEDSDLFEFLYEVKREKLGESLVLKGFGLEDTGLLIGEILSQRTVDEEFRDLVHSKTGGNPFFIEELVRSLVEQGVLFRTAQGWERKPISEIEIPSGIRTVIKQRLSNLDHESLDVLSVASVTSSESKEFSFALLRKVTGLDENRLVDTMERILKTRLIRETKMAGGRPGFSFTDTRIRDAIYDGMTLLRRGRYHLKTAQAIEELYKDRPEDVYGVLLCHYLKGNDQPKCLEYAVKAAERASSVYAHGEAVSYLKVALEALADSSDRGARSRVLEELGKSSMYSGRPDYAKYLEEAARLALEVGDNQRAASIYRVLAEWMFDLNRENYSVPNEYYEKARGLLSEEQETKELALFYHSLGRFYFLTGRLTEARELAEKALALAEKLGVPEVQAHAFLTLAILAPPSEKKTKFEYMQKALQFALEHNLPVVAMRAYNNLSVDCESPVEALKYIAEATSYFHRIGYTLYEQYANLAGASAYVSLGEPERAKEIAKGALSMPNLPPSAKAGAVSTMGEALLWQGNFDESEKYLRQWLTMLEGSQDFQAVQNCQLDLGMLYAEKGELQKSKGYLKTCLSKANERGLASTYTYVPLIMVALLYLTDVLIRMGNAEEAESTARQAAEIASKTGSELVDGLAEAIRGKLLAFKGELEGAEVSLGKAAATFRKKSWAVPLAESLCDLGVVRGKRGEWANSREAFTEATEIYTRMGAKTYLERVASASASIPSGNS
jgi:predicted ATPase/class 3 adenylate cyclase